MEKLMDFLGTWVLEPMGVICIVLLGLAMFVGLPFGMYKWATYTPPTTFELRKDSWECTESHTRQVERCGAKTGCHWVTEEICTKYEPR